MHRWWPTGIAPAPAFHRAEDVVAVAPHADAVVHVVRIAAAGDRMDVVHLGGDHGAAACGPGTCRHRGEELACAPRANVDRRWPGSTALGARSSSSLTRRSHGFVVDRLESVRWLTRASSDNSRSASRMNGSATRPMRGRRITSPAMIPGGLSAGSSMLWSQALQRAYTGHSSTHNRFASSARRPKVASNNCGSARHRAPGAAVVRRRRARQVGP